MTPVSTPVEAVPDEVRELLRKFLEFADADYVPNTLFDRARAIIEGRAIRPASPPRADAGASALADPRLVSLVAEIRQGQSSTPRCEPPGDEDIEIAAKWVGYVRRATAALATQPAEAVRAINHPDSEHQFAVTSSNYGRPFLLGCYATLDQALLAQGGKPEKWEIFARVPAEAVRASQEERDRIAEDEGDRLLFNLGKQRRGDYQRMQNDEWSDLQEAAETFLRSEGAMLPADRAAARQAFVVETELRCVNGLSAWFTIATVHCTDDAEVLMSGGSKATAEQDARAIVEAINRGREDGQPSDDQWHDLALQAIPFLEEIVDDPAYKQGAVCGLIRRIRFGDYDPTTQPFDEPFRHVETRQPSAVVSWRAIKQPGSGYQHWGIECDAPHLVDNCDEIVIPPCMPEDSARRVVAVVNELLHASRAALIALRLVNDRGPGTNEMGAIQLLEKAIAGAESE